MHGMHTAVRRSYVAPVQQYAIIATLASLGINTYYRYSPVALYEEYRCPKVAKSKVCGGWREYK